MDKMKEIIERKKTYRIGDIIATIKENEMKELKNLAETQIAIKQASRDLMKTLVDLEKENIQEQAEWWEKMRKKYNLPTATKLRMFSYLGENLVVKVSYETREIFIGVAAKEKE